jgi:hypothetical protein
MGPGEMERAGIVAPSLAMVCGFPLVLIAEGQSPANSKARLSSRTQRRVCSATRISFRTDTEHRAEIALFTLISAAGVLSIGFGLSLIPSLIANWEGFQAGVARLIQ